jgi:hypothetical protein
LPLALFELCLLLGPLRSLELLLLLSLLVLPIAPLSRLLRRASLIFVGGGARLVLARLVCARLICSRLRRARLVVATPIDALLLRLSAAPDTARASLSILGRHLRALIALVALILSAVSIILAALRLGRCRNEQQRSGRRKYAYVSHTFPQVLDLLHHSLPANGPHVP